MKALGPNSTWPRVWPRCRWPRRSLITIVRPKEPILIVKHWRGAPSTGPKNPASEDSALEVGNTSESPVECQSEGLV